MALPYTTSAWSTHALASAPAPEYPWPDDDYAQTITRTYEGLRSNYARRLNQRTSYTNLLLRSNLIDSASWTESEVTAANNIAANPADGTVTAGRILETTANAVHYLEQVVSAINPRVFSIFVKGLDRDTITLRLIDVFSASAGSVTFSLATATASVAAPNAGIIDLGAGWFRCWMVKTGADPLDKVQVIMGSGSAYTGDIAKGFYLYGAQLEDASTPGPVILTPSTSTVTISSPDTDAIANPTAQQPDPFAFLSAESGLAPLGGATFRYSRTYARIPAEQYDPLTKYLLRPSLDGIVNGSYYAASFDSGDTSHLWTSRKTVTRVSSAEAVTTNAAMPSGTVTCTDNLGNVCTFAANANQATIIAAINTLPGMTGGATVSTGNVVLTWSGPNYIASIVPPSGSYLAYYTAGGVAQLLSTGTSTTPEVTTLDAPSHGAAIGDNIALWSGDILVGRANVVSIPSADSVAVMTSDLATANTLITHLTVSRSAVARIVNGGKDCTARRRHRFYLPGYTSGITSRADIPNFDTVIDPIAWLGVIGAYYASPSASTYAVVETEEVVRYQGGPILDKAVIEVQVADAYQTRAV